MIPHTDTCIYERQTILSIIPSPLLSRETHLQFGFNKYYSSTILICPPGKLPQQVMAGLILIFPSTHLDLVISKLYSKRLGKLVYAAVLWDFNKDFFALHSSRKSSLYHPLLVLVLNHLVHITLEHITIIAEILKQNFHCQS